MHIIVKKKIYSIKKPNGMLIKKTASAARSIFNTSLGKNGHLIYEYREDEVEHYSQQVWL
jgi:hypothetical protein